MDELVSYVLQMIEYSSLICRSHIPVGFLFFSSKAENLREYNILNLHSRWYIIQCDWNVPIKMAMCWTSAGDGDEELKVLTDFTTVVEKW